MEFDLIDDETIRMTIQRPWYIVWQEDQKSVNTSIGGFVGAELKDYCEVLGMVVTALAKAKHCTVEDVMHGLQFALKSAPECRKIGTEGPTVH